MWTKMIVKWWTGGDVGERAERRMEESKGKKEVNNWRERHGC